MKSRPLAALLAVLPLALPAAAQDDRVFHVNGTVIDGVRISSFDVRELKYSKGSSNESLASDLVAKIELGKFADTFRRGLGNKDPDMMLTTAREQLESKNVLLAQLGFVRAASLFFDQDKAAEAVGALEEMQKALPDAGLVPEVYRQKFEYYMGLGAKGANSATQVAKKYQADAIGGAWPAGFGLEADFFMALAERVSGGNPKDFQNKLRSVVNKALGKSPTIVNRANVQLAHSLREGKDIEGARKIYDDLAKKDGVDSSSRAGAFLGLGMLLMESGSADKKDVYKQALLMFLRVRLETRDAWPSLHAEALYHAILAADKWRGSEYQYIMGRCRGVLFSDFADSEWAQKAKAGR